MADEIPDDLDEALNRVVGERVRALLADQLAALVAYGQPDDDPRVATARAQLAALDDVDPVDAPAPAPPSRRARRGTASAP